MLTSLVDPMLIVGIALNFFALGASRVRAVIRAVAVQGSLLGLLPLFVHPDIGVRGLLLVVGTITIKGFLIPGLLYHALREVNIQREVRPLVGHVASLLLAALGTGVALVFAHSLPLTDEDAGLLLVPASLSTVLAGFLMLTTRQKAIMQVVGYLLLENGIFMFGLLLLEAMPFLVEVGVLLDLFAGIFVMGIIIHYVNQEFASVSTIHLSELKE